jgi:hypothetical protein
MLKFLYKDINKRLNKQTIFKPKFKYNYTIFKVYKYKTPTVFSLKANYLKDNYIIYGSKRSFSSGNVKLRANTFKSIKDFTSQLQAVAEESSAETARRITRNPNPNRVSCLVKRIFTISSEYDLDTKINNMNDLLLESFWTENQEMGDRAKIALDKLLRHEILEGEEAFCIDSFFITEGISLEGLRLEDLRSKIETCQNFYIEKFSELQENLKEWNEEKNNLLLQQEESNKQKNNLLLQQEESDIDKGKQPDYNLHPSYLFFNSLTNNKRKFSEFNDIDPCDEGKIIKKAKFSHDTSCLLDDFADISCEPLDIIDLDG